MRLTPSSSSTASGGRAGSSSSPTASSSGRDLLLQPPRRKISLELKAWEDSLVEGNSSLSSFPKTDAIERDDDEINDDELQVRRRKTKKNGKELVSSNGTTSKKKPAVRVISRKNPDGSPRLHPKQQQKKQQQQQNEGKEKSSPASIRPPRSVQFYPRVRIRRIENLDDIDAETLQELYYNTDELQYIRDDLRRTIQKHIESTDILDDDENEDKDPEMVNGDHNDGSRNDVDEEFCLRGLENELPEMKQRRRLNKYTARQAVFQEQARQVLEGYRDMYQLSFVYKRQVQSSVQYAFLAASRDEWTAKKIHNDDI